MGWRTVGRGGGRLNGAKHRAITIRGGKAALLQIVDRCCQQLLRTETAQLSMHKQLYHLPNVCILCTSTFVEQCGLMTRLLTN